MRKRSLLLAVAAILVATSSAQAQGRSGASGGTAGDATATMCQLLQNPQVQQELGLTQRQQGRLQSHFGGGSGQGQTLPTGVLSHSQHQRLQQLQRQTQHAAEGLAALLTDPDVADQLQLTDEQEAEVGMLELGFRMWAFSFLRDQGFSADAFQTIQDLRPWVDQMLKDILDDNQLALLDELLGKPLPEGSGNGQASSRGKAHTMHQGATNQRQPQAAQGQHLSGQTQNTKNSVQRRQ
jgi:hypothetical protein